MTQHALPTIPGYRLSRLLGEGATARVYLARPCADNAKPELKGVRKVALKVLLPPEERESNPAAAEMFANEVRMTLQLRHPNLVRGFDGKTHGEGAFLALEYLPDGALSDLLMPGLPLPEEQALALLRGVAAGLAYMHGQGAVHQDIKPQNIYLCAERALLADFGAAYMRGQGGKAGGSPFYMAPEIYRGEEGTAASDIYSFSVLIYELLGGKRPFVGDDYGELMMEHLNTLPPSLLVIHPEAPSELAKLAQRGLSKAADARPNMQEFKAALDALLGEDEAAQAPAAETLGRSSLGRDSVGRGSLDCEERAAAFPSPHNATASGSNMQNSNTPAAETTSDNEPNLTQKAGALMSKLNPFKKKD